MRVILYAAVTADGFIAKRDGDSDWVADDELFEQIIGQHGCVVVGRKTFVQYEHELYPIDGSEHIVLTQSTFAPGYEHVHTAGSVEAALAQAKELGFGSLLVIGGSETFNSFAKAGVVTDVYLDVHPQLFGDGMRLLAGEVQRSMRLQLAAEPQQHEGFIHLEYTVNHE